MTVPRRAAGPCEENRLRVAATRRASPEDPVDASLLGAGAGAEPWLEVLRPRLGGAKGRLGAPTAGGSGGGGGG